MPSLESMITSYLSRIGDGNCIWNFHSQMKKREILNYVGKSLFYVKLQVQLQTINLIGTRNFNQNLKYSSPFHLQITNQ